MPTPTGIGRRVREIAATGASLSVQEFARAIFGDAPTADERRQVRSALSAASRTGRLVRVRPGVYRAIAESGTPTPTLDGPRNLAPAPLWILRLRNGLVAMERAAYEARLEWIGEYFRRFDLPVKAEDLIVPPSGFALHYSATTTVAHGRREA